MPDDVPLREFVETYWRLHAVPNLSPATREFYARTCGHPHPAPPRRLRRARADAEAAHPLPRRAREAPASAPRPCVKAMTIVQSILSLRGQRGARRVQRRRQRTQAPLRTRARAAHLPAGRGRGRSARKLEPARPHARLGPRVLRSAARGGRLPARLGATSASARSATATPSATASGTRRCSSRSPRTYASGSSPPAGPTGKQPVFPAHDGGFWTDDDWRNWRKRIWQGEPERPRRDRKNPTPRTPGMRPARTPGRGTCDRASSRSASTRASRSRRSVARSARASG